MRETSAGLGDWVGVGVEFRKLHAEIMVYTRGGVGAP